MALSPLGAFLIVVNQVCKTLQVCLLYVCCFIAAHIQPQIAQKCRLFCGELQSRILACTLLISQHAFYVDIGGSVCMCLYMRACVLVNQLDY